MKSLVETVFNRNCALALAFVAISMVATHPASAEELKGSWAHVSGSDNQPNGSVASVEMTNTASTNDKDWWARVGATATNTPDGGFSLGNDDAYWFVITYNGNFGLG